MTTEDKDTVSLGSTAGESSDGSAPVATPSFTPGPWRRFTTDGGREQCQIVDASGEIVASANSWQQEREANARLIAAAPELYEAFSETLAVLEKEYGHGVDNGYWPELAPRLLVWRALRAKVEGR